MSGSGVNEHVPYILEPILTVVTIFNQWKQEHHCDWFGNLTGNFVIEISLVKCSGDVSASSAGTCRVDGAEGPQVGACLSVDAYRIEVDGVSADIGQPCFESFKRCGHDVPGGRCSALGLTAIDGFPCRGTLVQVTAKSASGWSISRRRERRRFAHERRVVGDRRAVAFAADRQPGAGGFNGPLGVGVEGRAARWGELALEGGGVGAVEAEAGS